MDDTEDTEGQENLEPENPRIMSVSELVKTEYLSVPAYQRPYEWKAKNVRQLFGDIEKFMHKGEYRIGTIILYKNSDTGTEPQDARLDIVDGQQRVITFLLMIMALGEYANSATCQWKDKIASVLENADLQLADSSQESQTNIVDNYQLSLEIIENIGEDEGELSKFVDFFLEHCSLIIYQTDDIDEAFQMFDSQNSRGKELDPTDLLKAFHLRQMVDDHVPEERQKELVNQWESMSSSFVSDLFSMYLYRIRLWGRNESVVKNKFTAERIDEFEGISLSKDSFYPWQKPQIAAYDFSHSIDDSALLSSNEPGLSHDELFQSDAPIINGEMFFEWVEHYRQLCVECGIYRPQNGQATEPEFLQLTDSSIYKKLKDDWWNPRLLRCEELFNALLLYYVDRFGIGELTQAVKTIFVYSFLPRVKMQSVRFQSIERYVLSPDSQWILPTHVNAFASLRQTKSPEDFFDAIAFPENVIMPEGQLMGNGVKDSMKRSLEVLSECFTECYTQKSTRKTEKADCVQQQRVNELLSAIIAFPQGDFEDKVWGAFDVLRSVEIINHDDNKWFYHSSLWQEQGLKRQEAIAKIRGLMTEIMNHDGEKIDKSENE